MKELSFFLCLLCLLFFRLHNLDMSVSFSLAFKFSGSAIFVGNRTSTCFLWEGVRIGDDCGVLSFNFLPSSLVYRPFKFNGSSIFPPNKNLLGKTGFSITKDLIRFLLTVASSRLYVWLYLLLRCHVCVNLLDSILKFKSSFEVTVSVENLCPILKSEGSNWAFVGVFTWTLIFLIIIKWRILHPTNVKINWTSQVRILTVSTCFCLYSSHFRLRRHLVDALSPKFRSVNNQLSKHYIMLVYIVYGRNGAITIKL